MEKLILDTNPTAYREYPALFSGGTTFPEQPSPAVGDSGPKLYKGAKPGWIPPTTVCRRINQKNEAPLSFKVGA